MVGRGALLIPRVRLKVPRAEERERGGDNLGSRPCLQKGLSASCVLLDQKPPDSTSQPGAVGRSLAPAL